MLRTFGVTAFTVFELLREIQLLGEGWGVKLPPPTIQIMVKLTVSLICNFTCDMSIIYF